MNWTWSSKLLLNSFCCEGAILQVKVLPGRGIGKSFRKGKSNVISRLHNSNRKASRGPTSPPVLSVTEASGPRDYTFGGQEYHNGLLGGHRSAAQTAANVVFPKSPINSPGLPPSDFEHHRGQMHPDKPVKAEKPKVKLFSRPGKIGISKDKESRSGALPSPSKMNSYSMVGLQRRNMSTTSKNRVVLIGWAE